MLAYCTTEKTTYCTDPKRHTPYTSCKTLQYSSYIIFDILLLLKDQLKHTYTFAHRYTEPHIRTFAQSYKHFE